MSTRASFAQRVQLAQETRKRFVGDCELVLSALDAAVQERLTALMSEVATAVEMRNRRDAWTIYQRCRAAWVNGTLNSWQATLVPPVAAPRKKEEFSLELVGTDEAENRIAASRMVMGLAEKVSSELNDLLLRLKFLEGAQERDESGILRPDVLVLLMVAQWSKTDMPSESWALVSEPVLKLLAERLPQAYARANEYLIRKGVMPTIELADRVKRTAAGSFSPEKQVGQESGQGHFDGHSGGNDSTRPSLGSVGRRSSGYGSASEETRMMTSTSPLIRARSRAQGVLGQLKRLLMGSGGGEVDAMNFPQPPSPALAAAIAVRPSPSSGGDLYSGSGTVMEDFSPAGVAQVAVALRQRTTELKNKAETQSEKATIEIVALMFQAILQEDRIPPGIRVWFARLQMPVLRVALAEPDFFGTLNHPARQLIDRMGSCVMGFDASGIQGSALETEIKRVVQVIEQYPETGKRVYQLVHDEFQKFLAQFLTGKASTQKLLTVAQQVEEKETLTIQYTIEMRKMLKDMPVREEVREFLFKVWAEVLAVAAVRKGPRHLETLELKKAATDLVWAASAKPNRSDRARVIQDLPDLLQKIRAGMTLLGLAPSEQEAHIKTISATLTDAFLSKTQAIPDDQIAAMGERLANLEDFVSEDGLGDLPLDAESIEMMLDMDASMIDVVTDGGSKPTAVMLAWAQELELGAWFTLDHNSQVAQVQFVWRSDRKQLNLFASPNGHSYLIQAGRLAAYLQAGLLLPQEEESLTVRATRDALVKLEANPERLLG